MSDDLETADPMEAALLRIVDKMRAEMGDEFYWWNRELKRLEPMIDAEQAKIARAIARAHAIVDRAERKLAILEAKRDKIISRIPAKHKQ